MFTDIALTINGYVFTGFATDAILFVAIATFMTGLLYASYGIAQLFELQDEKEIDALMKSL